MNRPLVSVVMPAHNAERFIQAAIESVLGQTWENVELIVVDDGSTDHTPEILGSTTDPRLRSFFQPHQERSAARNHGIAQAQGAYLSFLDADDLYQATKLELQVPALERLPECGVVYSDIAIGDPDRRALARQGAPCGNGHGPSGSLFAHLAKGNFIPIHAALLRRSILDGNLRFDPQLSAMEDWDFWLQVSAKTSFHYIPGVVGHYRVHPRMTSHDQLRMWQGCLAVRQKLRAMPDFASLPPAVRQYSRFQEAILHLLSGEWEPARCRLREVLTAPPHPPRALLYLILTYLCPQATQRFVAWRSRRRSWLATARPRATRAGS